MGACRKSVGGRWCFWGGLIPLCTLWQKHPITPTNSVFSLSLHLLPWWFFKKWSLILPNFPNFHSLPLKKRRGIGRNKVYSPKTLWNNIFLFLCVPVRAFWCFFECFYCFPCLIWFFVKIFPYFYNQIKHKAVTRFCPPNKNKPMETLQTK